jgi:hypothetical protein
MLKIRGGMIVVLWVISENCKHKINTISNPTTTAVDPMPAPIPIAVELFSSSDATVKQEFENEMYYTSYSDILHNRTYFPRPFCIGLDRLHCT